MSALDLSPAYTVPDPREMLYVMPSTFCNLRCRFCAQSRSTIFRGIMPEQLFRRVVDEACAWGVADFGLTPMIGEPLTDPGFLDKLRLLEEHPAVQRYAFCTNLTLADADFFATLPVLTKLTWLSVSVYGHDAASFALVTRSHPRWFTALMANLRRLTSWGGAADHLEIRVRSTADFELRTGTTELAVLLRELAARGARIRVPSERYSNWGGLIVQEEVDCLGIRLKPLPAHETLPCAMLFFKHTVLPDGRLNGCSDNDAHASMIIGDLTRQSFAEIYSDQNEAYLGLIREQQEGRHSPSCAACSSFRSPLEGHYSHAFCRRPFLTLEQFAARLERPA